MDFDISGVTNYKQQLCHKGIFHDKLPRLSRIHEDKNLNEISNHPGISLVVYQTKH